jgi:hypothetical protein
MTFTVKQLKPFLVKCTGIDADNIDRAAQDIASQPGIPKIGFFWWKRDNGKIILPIVAIFDDANSMMRTDHFTIWEAEKELGTVEGDFRETPRGRVSWDTGLGRSVVYSGEHNPPKELVRLLVALFNLDENHTDFVYNRHYDMDDMAEDMFSED